MKFKENFSWNDCFPLCCTGALAFFPDLLTL